MNEWTKKIWCGILFSHKKNKILAFATTWIKLEDIVLSEIQQTEKDKCHITFLYVESSKTKTKNEREKKFRLLVARGGQWQVVQMSEGVKRFKN